MPLRPARPLAVGLAGIGLMSALAGCATAAPDPGGAGGAGGATGGATAGAGTTLTGPYADGTYTEDGSYLSPAGQQTVTVNLTMAGDQITKITVTPHATDPTAKQYQAMFVQGIAAVVVGKDIDKLSVSRVAGSSLTSGGFNKAIEAIKADAKS